MCSCAEGFELSSEQESDRRRFRWPLVQWPDTCRSRPATFMTCGCIVIEPNGKNTTLQTTPRHVWTTEGCRLLSTLCSQLILVIFSFLSCIEILNNGIKGCITYQFLLNCANLEWLMSRLSQPADLGNITSLAIP